MNLKDILYSLKEYLLEISEEKYDIDNIYFGLLVEVNNEYLKNIEYLGGYDWKYTQHISYKKIGGLILKKINKDTYQHIDTKKCYKTDDSLENDYRMQVGEQYICTSSLIPYTEVIPKVFNQKCYLTKDEITTELKKYSLQKNKAKK